MVEFGSHPASVAPIHVNTHFLSQVNRHSESFLIYDPPCVRASDREMRVLLSTSCQCMHAVINSLVRWYNCHNDHGENLAFTIEETGLEQASKLICPIRPAGLQWPVLENRPCHGSYQYLLGCAWSIIDAFGIRNNGTLAT